MVEKSISFRTHLQSNTTDLLAQADISCVYTVRLIIGLISQLAAYTEEGVPLSPSVFICNSISSLIGLAGSGEHVCLIKGLETAVAAPKILKYAAPLCSEGWRIYVERSADGKTCSFGVFCGLNDPSSFTVEDMAFSDHNPSFPIVRVAQSVTNKVEVRTSAGDSVEFRFNDDQDVADLKNNEKIRILATAACRDLTDRTQSFEGFMERVLYAAVMSSHGTLIAVQSAAFEKMLDPLSDAVYFDPPIDLHARFLLHFKEDKTAISVSRLQSAASLLTGFVCSDGITILSSSGQVVGYRAFIRSEEPTAPSDGGARSRAYKALSGLLGKGIISAFFRSQDGRMDVAIHGAAQ